MNDSRNPFAAPENGRTSASRSAIWAWIVALMMTLAAGAVLALWSRDKALNERELKNLQAELGNFQAELERTSGELSRAASALQTNKALTTALARELAEVQREKEQVGRRAKTLEEEMRAELESKDVAISKLQGRLTVTIVDRVMFDSGEADLKPEGAAVMQKIADLLASHPELKIHVVGHTDNVPIRQTAQSRFASNWELSAARALAAVHFLTEKAGVDPHRVGAVGYGEFRPVADNATAEGRAKNRRIAITILPDELADPDATATPLAASPSITNTATAQETTP